MLLHKFGKARVSSNIYSFATDKNLLEISENFSIRIINLAKISIPVELVRTVVLFSLSERVQCRTQLRLVTR